MVAFLVPIGSIYKHKFSEKIMALQAAGLIDKHFRDTNDKVATLLAESQLAASAPIQLSMYHMQGAFMVWAMLTTISLLAFGLEIFGQRCKYSARNI
jgi:hypothetical protein